jgi:predicted outer membrane repeat protein
MNRNRFRFGWERCEERTLLSTFNVTSTLDNGDNTNPIPGSLRAAVVAANADTDPAGSIIGFDPSVFGSTPQLITLGGSELLLSSSNVTITGPGAALLAISGNGQSRVFEVAATADASLSGLTVENGAVSDMNGGGILNSGVLSVSGCTISGNRAIQLLGSSATGGGIDNNSGTLRISDCTLAGNSAFGGGGIGNGIGYNLSGSMSVTDCTFSGNSAVGGGGGISSSGPLAGNLTPVVATVSGCTFSDNSVPGEGGAIDNGGGMTISGCNFSGNSSGWRGGGAFRMAASCSSTGAPSPATPLSTTAEASSIKRS